MDWKSKYYLYYKILQFAQENGIGVNTDLENFCSQMGWYLIPYPKDNLAVAMSISKDGFTIKDGNNFFIMYNPYLKKDCFERFRFTIAHEIGHIYLYHHIFVNNNILMHGTNKNSIWEQQADIFAQNFLLPLKYKKFYIENSLYEICKSFCVSKKMAITRINKMYEDELFIRKLNIKF